jgi:NAD(P)-dependent dehydrogenase (short-subunit alcohol dehydrogenase family)
LYMLLALLTGVGREGQVGEAVAARLARDGFDLLLVDRTAANVQDRAASLRDSGRKATPLACDLSDADAVAGLFRNIRKEHGASLNALVHMAGGFAMTGPVAETEVAAWDHQLTINLRTAFLVARGAIPLLREGRGAMVFFSSESALTGAKVAQIGAYAVAKSGVVALTTAISQEERSSGIRANVVAPAAIRTTANVAAMANGSRFVEREDVAATVSYLCSDASVAINGQVLRLTAR